MASSAVSMARACAAIGVVVACVATASRPLAAQNLKPASTTPAGELKPGPGSPLTIFDTTLFALAADERTILARVADLSEPWRVLKTLPRPAGGLAASRDAVFASHPDTASIVRVRLSGEIETIFAGAPLQRPAELAFAAGLVIYDRSSGLFRLDPDAPKPRLEPIEIPSASSGRKFSMDGPPGFLGAVGRDAVLSIPQAGQIFDIRNADRPAVASIKPLLRPNDWLLWGETRDLVEFNKSPQLRNPDRTALYRGVVYATQSLTGRLYAFSRNNPRPVRIVRSGPTGDNAIEAVAVAVTWRDLFVLDRRGEVVSRPRVIPADVNFPVARAVDVPLALYEYLYERRMLPVRNLTIQRTLHESLSAARVLWGGNAQRLNAILCGINEGLCGAGNVLPALASRTIRVPDLTFDRYIDSDKITLPGEETLGATIGRLIPIPQDAKDDIFKDYRTEKELQSRNRGVGGGPLLERTRGSFYVPVERYRYVAPVLASDEAGPLAKLMEQYSGLSVELQQEERRSREQSASGEHSHDVPDLEKMRTAFKQVLDTIHYKALPDGQQSEPIRVGVAEKSFDRRHPAFVNPKNQTDVSWALPPTGTNATADGGAPAATHTTVDVRNFDKDKADHGTAVSAIIGGRMFAFGYPGLAPHVTLVPILSENSVVKEEIRQAINRDVRLINVSAHYEDGYEPPNLRERVYRESNVLYVVAAGNDVRPDRPRDQQRVCADFSVYPACWASRFPNVLVVTGTTEAGDALLGPVPGNPPVPGANWDDSVVHVAAPAVGFHAPGEEGVYVPVRGSSFAAPMVTATAAMLLALGLERPVVIKERILATADPVVGLDGLVRAGRLNVERAISNVRVGVLSKKDGNGVETRQVVRPDAALNSIIRLRHANRPQDDLPIGIHRIRRLHMHNGHYRVVYLSETGVFTIQDGLEFPDDDASKFMCLLENGTTAEFKLVDWDDYVGPVSR